MKRMRKLLPPTLAALALFILIGCAAPSLEPEKASEERPAETSAAKAEAKAKAPSEKAPEEAPQTDPIVGKWAFAEGSSNGASISAEAAGMSFTFTFKEDGTFESRIDGEAFSGSWEKDKNVYKLESGGDAFTITLKDRSFFMDYENLRLTFEKAE